jgi:hypothetical protein
LSSQIHEPPPDFPEDPFEPPPPFKDFDSFNGMVFAGSPPKEDSAASLNAAKSSALKENRPSAKQALPRMSPGTEGRDSVPSLCSQSLGIVPLDSGKRLADDLPDRHQSMRLPLGQQTFRNCGHEFERNV